MNACIRTLCLLVVSWATSTQAGSACSERVASPRSLAAAAATAMTVAEQLERSDLPVALVARVGRDLAAQGLVYSHVGIVVRDHPSGRWRVLHLLNDCGSERSALYVEGLVNFFADDLERQDARLIALEPTLAARLLTRLDHAALRALHEPRYSLIARPHSRQYQNSTAWLLEVLAAAQLPQPSARIRAQALLQAQAFAPDEIRIAYSKRVVGGMFSANLAFGDHPVSARLAGRYDVVSVRSILRHLEAQGQIAQQWEWRDGRWHTAVGPA